MFLFSSSRICFLIYVLFSLNLISADTLKNAKEWRCADEKCSVPISLATVTKPYIPDVDTKIGVKTGDKVHILRKPADPSDRYYHVKSLVSGKEGLLKNDFFRENQNFYQNQNLMKVKLNKKSVKNKTPDISPSAPTNVYDGTTIVESYEDAHYPYEPTQAQGQSNDAGSPSVVQSTTPPSVISDNSPLSVNSAEIESKNISKGEQESKGISSIPSTSSGGPMPPGSTSDDERLHHDDIGISSTSASTINNEPSQSHDILKDADIVSATTEIPVSPGPIQIDKSQMHESVDSLQETTNVEVENGSDTDDVQLDTAKKGETILENIATSLRSFIPFGNDDSSDESESKKSMDQQDNSVVEIPGELQSAMNSGNKQVESDANIKSDSDSTQTPNQDTRPVNQQVISDQHVEKLSIPAKPVYEQLTLTVPTKEASDLNDEQSSGNGELGSKLRDPDIQKDLSDTVPSDQLSPDSGSIIPTLNSTIEDLPSGVPAPSENPNPVSSDDKSDPQPASSQNVAAENENSVQNVSNPVDQLDAQSADQNETVHESEEPLASLPTDVKSLGASGSQDNLVKYEPTQPALSEVSDPDPDAGDEISADSGEDESNTNSESSMPEDRSSSNDPVETLVRTENEIGNPTNITAEQADSVSTMKNDIENHKTVEQPAPPSSAFTFSSNFDFVDPRLSNSAVSPSSPIVVPEPTNSPPSALEDESFSRVDVDVTTPPPAPEIQPPPIIDTNGEIEQDVTEEPPSDSSDPWYSGILSSFGSIRDIFSSSTPEPEVIPSGADTPEVTPKFQVSEDTKSETCTAESCDPQSQITEEIEHDDNYLADEYAWLSPRGIILMIITATAVLLFSLGHYYLENLKRDVELVSKYNDLAGKLFIEQKEKEMLAEQVTSVNESMTQISFDTTKYDKDISDLKTLVQKYKEEKSAIEEKEKETRKKFMMVDKNYNELRNMLSQNKLKGERSALILDIKNLKESIAGNNIEIASLKEQLIEKKEEIKSLNVRIVEFVETNKQLEKNVENAISENHETAQKYQDNIAKLKKTIEESTVARVKLEKECTQLKKEKESLAIEKELAESSLQKFQRLKPSNSLTEWLDAKEVRVSLLAAEKKIDELATIRDNLTREKILVEEKERTLAVDLEQLNEKYEKAEKEKIEALTKLQVLSDYFKEKETQLQEELGTKESLWLQKQSDDRTIYEQMRALREENTSFKNQNETLKREILDQEASFKKLITSAEEKAHENWVALRHQERRLKEAQMEASQLRSRLTALESAGDNSDDKMNKGDVNGDIPPFGSATSPPFMLYPEFVPLPPLLPTTPSRPPPLGRISSPPLGDFTPPPPLVPYEMFLPPSPPPPAPHVLHKPQPLDGSHRIQKDSQSSNHSSESVPDRPRRNKR